METKAEIIQRNENAAPKGSWMEREYVKRSTAFNGMSQFAEQIAVIFLDWSRNKEQHLSGSDLFKEFIKETGIEF